jgi:hypothetical protein
VRCPSTIVGGVTAEIRRKWRKIMSSMDTHNLRSSMNRDSHRSAHPSMHAKMGEVVGSLHALVQQSVATGLRNSEGFFDEERR